MRTFSNAPSVFPVSFCLSPSHAATGNPLISVSFCEPCIKTKHFKYVKNVCPICRKKIPLKINYFSVNVILDQFLQNRYKGQKVLVFLSQTYEERILSTKKALYPKGIKWLDDFEKWFKEMTPWIIICVLLYHLVNVKINVFAFSI